MKNRKTAIIIIGVLLVIAIITGVTVNSMQKNWKIENQYQDIIKSIDKKDYISAIAKGYKIPDYKDVDTLINIGEAFYNYEEGNYYEVNTYINRIPKDYSGKYKKELDRISKDAKEKLKQAATSTTTTTTTTTRYDDYDYDDYDLDDDDDYDYTTKKRYNRATKKTKKYDDPYDAKDYANEEDFYYDHYDDFYDYEEAEDYYDEYGD